jgi:hypothetical protein
VSLLSDKKELKKAAKELTLVKLTEVIETLNSVMAERQQEVEVIARLEQYAKDQGFTMEQLGYKQSSDVVIAERSEISSVKRPVKPKFKTINKYSQFFYVENGQLHLLRTHTMKKGLQQRGIEVVPLAAVDKKFANDIDTLIAEATLQAAENFNSKVLIWNEWAVANGAEILDKR